MSGSISTERLFSLACFEGVRLIRGYAKKQPDLDPPALQALIEKLEPDGANLDLEASIHLHSLVEADCVLSGSVFYQSCIRAVIVNYKPTWLGSMRQGRKRFVQSLDQNDRDIFIAAGLVIDPPPWEVVMWWDMVVGHARLAIDLEKMEQARQAEQLTIEHEKKRLEALGIDKNPSWMGLDDNFAGYDVLSYDLEDGSVISKMIEVKSTTASPLRFILTRSEWEEAKKVGKYYLFHAWDMMQTPPILFTLDVKSVEPHIPSDNKKGKWKNVEIPISV